MGIGFPRAVGAGLLLAALVLSLTSCSPPSGQDRSAPGEAAIRTLLAAQSAAVLHHDRRGYLAGVSIGAGSRAFRARQVSVYTNLSKLPLASWQYLLGVRTDDAGAEKTAASRYHVPVQIMVVTIRYALRGYDEHPTSRQEYWTFARVGGKVVVAGDDDLAADGGSSALGPWDFGPLTVVHGSRSLVLGHPGQPGLESIAAQVDAAVPAVTAVWGTGWPQRVVVLVPHSVSELNADAGPAATITSDVPALTVSDTTDPLSRGELGLRLIVNPAALDLLSPLGRRIVLRHEITHIAAAGVTTGSSPRWLVEGFADYVGQLDDGQPVTVAAAELRTALHRGLTLTGLPSENEFDDQATAARAYEQSWLACRLIAEEAGQAGLVRLYRVVGEQVNPETALATGLKTVLGVSVASFTARWRDYVTAQLR